MRAIPKLTAGVVPPALDRTVGHHGARVDVASINAGGAAEPINVGGPRHWVGRLAEAQLRVDIVSPAVALIGRECASEVCPGRDAGRARESCGSAMESSCNLPRTELAKRIIAPAFDVAIARQSASMKVAGTDAHKKPVERVAPNRRG